MMSLLLILFFGSSFHAAVNAQQVKTIRLDQAIQMALDSNLTVRSSVYTVGMVKALKGASWDIPKTTVEGQYGQFNSLTKDNSFTVSQSFAFPTVYINQNKLSKANVKSSEIQLKISQLEIATQVKQIYWQIAYLHSRQKLFAHQDSLYSGFLRAAELRAKSGETNRLEMMTARSQSMEIKNQLQQVTADLNISNQKLQIILNTESVLNPVDTVLRRLDFALVADTSALTGNPSAEFSNQQIEVSRFEKKLELSRLTPDFSIGYFSQTMQGVQEVNGFPRSFGSKDRFSGVQAGISIPLWFTPYTSRIHSAKLKEKVAQTDAEAFSKSLNGNYRSLLNEYAKYKNSLDYYEKQAVPEAEIIVEQATKSYRAGAMDYLDYIQNLSHALNIRQNHLEALNNYNQILISLDFITGKIF